MPADSRSWMIYGANGYTGRLIARRAAAEGQRPILAGRNREPIEALADELSCPARLFSLDQIEAVAAQLDGVSAVLNCAGPFVETAKTVIEACLRAGAHYLDITGEIDVIEFAQACDARAKSAGIVIMPAVGFDVVPSDCLALQLAEALPDAVELEIAFATFGKGARVSPGTAATIFMNLGQGGKERREGRIVRVPFAQETVRIPFPSGELASTTISWADVATAFYTTGIPNIRAYMAMSSREIARIRRLRWLFSLVGSRFIQWLGRKWIKRSIVGPSEEDRTRGRAEFWGRATDAEGRRAEAVVTTPEGYRLTVLTALEIAGRVARGDVSPGFSTPARAFGGRFIEQFEDVRFEWRTRPA